MAERCRESGADCDQCAVVHLGCGEFLARTSGPGVTIFAVHSRVLRSGTSVAQEAVFPGKGLKGGSQAALGAETDVCLMYVLHQLDTALHTLEVVCPDGLAHVIYKWMRLR